MILRFRIPMAGVSVNSMYERHARGVHKAAAARVFAEAAAAFGLRARKRAGWVTFGGPVECVFVVYASNARMDEDAVLKIVQDSLQKSNARKRMLGSGIIDDDNQVQRVVVEKRAAGGSPYIEVMVAPVGELTEPALVDNLLEKVRSV